MRIDLTLTCVDTFHPENDAAEQSSDRLQKFGTLAGPAGTAIDWVEFELYNTDSDYYPTHTITGGETDFYASNMWITFNEDDIGIPEPTTFGLLVLGVGVFAAAGARRREEN